MDAEKLENKIEEKIEQKVEEKIEGQQDSSDNVLEKKIEEKLEEKLGDKQQQVEQKAERKQEQQQKQIDRRKFLKMAGLGAGGLALASQAGAGFVSLSNTSSGSMELSTVLSNGNDINSHDIVDGGTTVWDTSEGEVPNAAVEGLANLSSNQAFSAYPIANTDISNSSVTVSSGTNLSGGGTISLGGSKTLNLDSALNGITDVSNTGSVSIDIDSDNNASSETFTVTQDGGATTLLQANEGGPVEVLTSDLRLPTGNAIEDGSGNKRMEVNGSFTEFYDESGNRGLILSDGGENQIAARSSQPFVVRDFNGGFDAVTYLTSSSAPGTLELTNSELQTRYGIEVEGSTRHSYAGVAAGPGANNGHLMIDSNGGNLYLNWDESNPVRLHGSSVELYSNMNMNGNKLDASSGKIILPVGTDAGL